jgi:hypothetical protein
MATQREWESVVWHFVGDNLKDADPNVIKEWIYGFEPNTEAQEKRWLNAIQKVQEQIERFAGDETCEDECIGFNRV